MAYTRPQLSTREAAGSRSLDHAALPTGSTHPTFFPRYATRFEAAYTFFSGSCPLSIRGHLCLTVDMPPLKARGCSQHERTSCGRTGNQPEEQTLDWTVEAERHSLVIRIVRPSEKPMSYSCRWRYHILRRTVVARAYLSSSRCNQGYGRD